MNPTRECQEDHLLFSGDQRKSNINPSPKKINLFLPLLSSSFSVMNPPSPLFATSLNHTKKRKTKKKTKKREPLDLTLSSLPFPAFGLLLHPLLYCFSSFYLKFILPFLKLPLPVEKSLPKADPPLFFLETLGSHHASLS